MQVGAVSNFQNYVYYYNDRCNGLQHMSESMFVGMCQMVGTSRQVAIRRETADIEDMLDRQIKTNNEVIEMLSGSYREGFRLKGSDMDYMFWPNDHRVIIDMSQYCNTANKTLILSDSSDSLYLSYWHGQDTEMSN